LVNDARIALGAVSPTIFRVEKAEKYLLGKTINTETIAETGKLCFEAATPISDIRASEEYRDHILPVLIEKAMNEIQSGTWKDFPEAPVLLWGKKRETSKP
jgi:carbon-monoxide dehydrogenase medium subunit